MVKNLDRINTELDLWMKQVRQMSVEQYRDFVWAVFRRVLHESPQASGRGVANWRLSIGRPDDTVNYALGDEPGVDRVQDKTGRWRTKLVPQHVKGDERWIKTARDRALRVVKEIGYGDKVYISNSTVGTNKDGSAQFYMVELQDASYWSHWLRAANQPYETAKESILAVTMEKLAGGSFPARIGGDNWRE